MKKLAFLLLGLIGLVYFLAAEKPDFTLKDFNDRPYSLSQFVGKKVVLIQFWAHWCLPGQESLKKIVTIYKSRKAVLDVILINIDDSKYVPAAKTMAQKANYPFVLLLDKADKETWIKFNPNLEVPYSVLLDFSGNIAWTHSGYIPGDEKELLAKIDQLLQRKGN